MSDDRFADPSDAAPDDVTIPDPEDPQSQGLNPPAPIIDLGGDASSGPSRPLGPRRLALLREQMAKHHEEVARSSSDDPTHVDPVLAQKQRRMAELASRAAISSEEDRQLADEAIAQTQSIPPITDERLAEMDAAEAQGDDQPEPADSAESAAQETPWSAPVPVVPAAETQQDERSAEAETGTDAELDEPAEESSEPQTDEQIDQVEEATAAPETTEALEPEVAEERSSSESAEAAGAAADDDEREPSAPVRAVNAQGLQLMEPRDYRSRVDWRTPALTIAAILVVALVAVLIFLVL